MVAAVWMGRMWQLTAVSLGCTCGSSVLFGRIALALGGLCLRQDGADVTDEGLLWRRILSLWCFCPSPLQCGVLGGLALLQHLLCFAWCL